MRWLVALSLLLWGAPAWAAPRLAVLELTGPNAIPAPAVRYLGDRVRGELVRQVPGWLVMTRENLQAHLPPGVALAECEGDCVVTTARKVGADAVISGEIVALKGDLRVLLKLHSTADGALLATANRGGESIQQLEANVAEWVAPLAKALAIRPAPKAGPAAQRIDFSDAEDGDHPSGYGGLRVYAALRDKVLAAPREGTWETTIPVRFTGDFALTVHMTGNTQGQQARCTRLTLRGSPPIDAVVCPHPDDRWTFGFEGGPVGTLRAAHDQIMPVRIIRAGDTLRLVLDDRMMASQAAPSIVYDALILKTRTGPPMRGGKVDGFALEAISLGAPR